MCGVGNPLLGDDGLGLEALANFREVCPCPDVDTVAAPAPVQLVEVMAGARALVIFDAMVGGGPPGTPYALDGWELDGAGGRPISLHGWGTAEICALARVRGIPVRLLGTEPACTEGMGLSPEVRASIPLLVQAALEYVSQVRCVP